MGLDVWFREDIQRILAAAFVATGSTLQLPEGEERAPFARGYYTGYSAALTTIAAAFGVPMPKHVKLPEMDTDA